MKGEEGTRVEIRNVMLLYTPVEVSRNDLMIGDESGKDIPDI